MQCVMTGCGRKRKKGEWVCADHMVSAIMAPRAHKYGAVRTTVGNITFDSKAEAARYQELVMLEKAGKIKALRLQHRWNLKVGDITIGAYVSDFDYYTDEGVLVIEDTKGVRTPLYNWKAKHVAAQFGVVITET